MRTARLTHAVVLLLSLVTSNSSCTRSEIAEPVISPYKLGQLPFFLDLEQVNTLSLSRNDPETGQTWSATLVRKTPGTASDHWEISPGSTAVPLKDTYADSALVLHLLDTLKTLKITDPNITASDGTMGLQTPQWILEWHTPEKTERLSIGRPIDTEKGNYARIGSTAVSIKGATLTVLGFIKTFQIVRHQRLILFESRNVQKITVEKNGKRSLYAERLSKSWTPAVEAWLERFTHLRIDDFADSEVLSTPAKPVAHITLETLTGKSVTEVVPVNISKDGVDSAFFAVSESDRSDKTPQRFLFSLENFKYFTYP
jgi:hypothetical protein